MHYSTIFSFVFVVVVNFSLSGAYEYRGQRNSNPLPQTQANAPQWPQDQTVDIGNGRNKVNILQMIPNEGGSYPPQFNTRTNIGNGANNYNVVSSGGGSRTFQLHNTPTRNSGVSFSPDPNSLYHVGYGSNNVNLVYSNGRPVTGGDRTPQNSGNTADPRFNGGQASHTIGTSLNNIGHGQNNINKIYTAGPEVPVIGGGRTTQTNGNTANTRRTNINPVIVNGKAVQPDHVDEHYSTYNLQGQTIHVKNLDNQQPIHSDTNNLYAELMQIKSQLQQLLAKLNI